MNILKKYITYQNSLWMLVIMFTLLYSSLCFYNRLATDDFYFLWAQKHIGIINCVSNGYQNFSGRWTANTITCALLRLYNSNNFLFVFNLAIFFLLQLGIYLLFGNIISLAGIILKKSTTLLLASIILINFFFTSFNLGESWFWYTSVCSYMLSLIAAIFLFANINNTKFTLLNSLILIICSLFIGGASESFAVITLLFLFLALLISLSKIQRIQALFQRSKKQKIILSILLLSASFAITAIAPGNAIRLSVLPHSTPVHQLIMPFKSWLKFLFLLLTNRFSATLLFSLPFLFFGEKMKSEKTISVWEWIKEIKLVLIAFTLLLFVMLLPATLVLSEFPPDRALLQAAFIISLFCCWLFFYAGKRISFSNSTIYKLKLVTWIGAFAFLSYVFTQQFRTTKTYATAYDNRISNIKSESEINNNQIILDSLPPSGMLYNAEISADTAFHSNQHLRQALEIINEVRVK